MEYVYLNLEETDRRPAARFKRSAALAHCSAFVFALFALGMFALRHHAPGHPAVESKWRLVFYGFWPLILMGVGGVLAIDLLRVNLIDPTHTRVLASFAAGLLWLLLSLLTGSGSILLRALAMAAMFHSVWLWWDSLEIVHFDSATLFYLNKNVAAFVAGWCHVNCCFLLYTLLAPQLRRCAFLAGAVYFLLLTGGLAGLAARVHSVENIFGLKNFIGFALAVLGGGLAFCLA